MERQLKAISKNGIAEALAKVQHYRYLNQAEEAESICRDILAIDPENQMALRQLGLALTDQFRGTLSDGFHEAQASFENAMHCFEDAEKIRPQGNDDALLRWNRCLRLIQSLPALTSESDSFDASDAPP